MMGSRGRLAVAVIVASVLLNNSGAIPAYRFS
jgi:hypothetical protein